MAPIRWKSKIILFKLETTYGVDPTPTGAANAVLATNVVFTPMEGEDVSRDLERPWLGAQPMIPTGLRGRMTARIELVPSGTEGVAPAWGPLMRACGCAQTIVTDTSVTYAPISDTMESGTLYFQMGGTLHKLAGCRGTGALKFTAQGLPYFEIDLMGLWSQPAEAARPTPDYSAWQKPEVVTNTNTPDFSINGVDLVMREVSLDLGNQVEARLLVGSESIIIPDRAETLMARVEAVPVTTLNPYALANALSLLPVELVHGTTTGKITTLSLPNCQMKRLTGFENAQNILEWPLELTPLPSSGNDQWTLALT